MRVTYLAHRVPFPPNKGDKIRAFHEIRALRDRGHDIHLYAFADDPADLDHDTDLRQFCSSVTLLPLRALNATSRVLRGLAVGASLSIEYYNSPAMHSAVRRGVERARPDALVVYSSSMAQYVSPQLRARTVVDLVDVDSEKWRDYSTRVAFPRSALYALESRRLRDYEESLVREFRHILLTTPREVAILRGGAEDRMHALMNGVDTEFFHPATAGGDASSDIVFTGAMDYFPNVDAVRWFAHDVWPALRQAADVTFTIVGSRPAAAVRALARIPGITVTGTVADVRPYLQRAAVVAVPLRVARGVQNKVLEAMACGAAVVATPVSVESFDAVDLPVRVASGAGQFTDTIAALLNNPRERAALGRAGRLFVEQHHRWEPMLRRFCDLIESTASASAGAA